jgi:hypothetical protein
MSFVVYVFCRCLFLSIFILSVPPLPQLGFDCRASHLARQALYHASLAPLALFALVIGSGGFAQASLNLNPLSYASFIIGITGTGHHTQL